MGYRLSVYILAYTREVDTYEGVVATRSAFLSSFGIAVAPACALSLGTCLYPVCLHTDGL